MIDWTALALTLRLAAAASIGLAIVGVPIAYWIAFSRWRWKFLVEALVALPLVLPPTVLGFYLLVALSPIGLAFTFSGLLIGSMLYSLPFAVQPMAAAFAAVDRRLIEASWSLGVSPLGTFRRVVLPLSLRGLAAGLILSFAHTIGEFGVVLMIGGNIPGVTRTVSIAIYDATQALDYRAANRTSVVLLALSFSILVAASAVPRASWPFRAAR